MGFGSELGAKELNGGPGNAEEPVPVSPENRSPEGNTPGSVIGSIISPSDDTAGERRGNEGGGEDRKGDGLSSGVEPGMEGGGSQEETLDQSGADTRSTPRSGDPSNPQKDPLPPIPPLDSSSVAVPPLLGLAPRSNDGCGTDSEEKVYPVRDIPFLFKLPDGLSAAKDYWVRCERAMYDSAVCWLTDENRLPILIKNGAERNFRWSFTVNGCSSKLTNVEPVCAKKENIIAKEITIDHKKIGKCKGSTLNFVLTDLKKKITYKQKLNFIATPEDF